MFFADPEAAFRYIGRAIQPGGHVVSIKPWREGIFISAMKKSVQ